MTVAAGAKGRVFRLASRVVLRGHARPVVDGVAQADVGGLAHEHDAALAGSLGDGSYARQTSKRPTDIEAPGSLAAAEPRTPRRAASRGQSVRPRAKIVGSSHRTALASAPRLPLAQRQGCG